MDECPEGIEHAQNLRLFKNRLVRFPASLTVESCAIREGAVRDVPHRARPIAEGVAGYVKQYRDRGLPLIAKIAKNPRPVQIYHEYLVGKTMADLRPLTPVFSIVQGVIRCATDDKNLLCTPGGTQENFQLIYDRIKGESFVEFSSRVVENKEDVRLLLLHLRTLFVGLKVAAEKCKFTHHDLHGENVIVASYDNLQEPFFIKNVVNGVTRYYICSHQVPTIIDYGEACRIIDGQMKTTNDQEFEPIHDVYRLLMTVVDVYAYFDSLDRVPRTILLILSMVWGFMKNYEPSRVRDHINAFMEADVMAGRDVPRSYYESDEFIPMADPETFNIFHRIEFKKYHTLKMKLPEDMHIVPLNNAIRYLDNELGYDRDPGDVLQWEVDCERVRCPTKEDILQRIL